MNPSDKRLSRRTVLRGGLAGGAVITVPAWLAACGGDSNQKPTSSPSDAVTSTATNPPKPGGTLRLALANSPGGLDPSTTRSGYEYDWLYNIYDTLVGLDPKLNPVKAVAQQWEQIDNLTVRFDIASGLTFQDGSPLSAQDIKYTIERNQDPAVGSYAAAQVAAIDRVEITSATQVVLHLKTPVASLFSVLADRGGMILPSAVVEKKGKSFTNSPVGSGVMKLDNWAVDSSLKLSRFEQYREHGLPYLDAADFQIVPNSSTQSANIKSGNTDFIWVASRDALDMQHDDAVQFYQWPSIGYTQVSINISQAPLTDVRVRQAMSHALDRGSILKAIYFGQGQVAGGPLTPATWAYNADLKPPIQDLTKAKQLLSAAGHADGLSFQMVFVPTEESTPLAQLLKSQFQQVGINIELVQRTSTVAAAEYRDQKYPMGATFGFSGRADPDLTIAENFGSKGGFNRASFNKTYVLDEDQKNLDALITKASQEYDLPTRKSLYAEIQRIIVDNVHGLFFTYDVNQAALSKRVRGFTPHGDGKLRLRDVWLDGG